MKLVVIGGTHGNEFTGVEIIRNLERDGVKNAVHDYELIFANPKSHEMKRRFVDFDLNRSFGNPKAFGYEKERSEQLRKKIAGNFDYLIDLHSSTSNMGLTIMLNYSDYLTLNAACYLKSKFPEAKIIMGEEDGKTSPFIGSLCCAGMTIEVGPVANNLIDARLLFLAQAMVEALLAWDFKDDFINKDYEVFQSGKSYLYPTSCPRGDWYIHPSFQNRDFVQLKKGTPIFINMAKEEFLYEGESTYPFFINEAAYFDARVAFSTAHKITIGDFL